MGSVNGGTRLGQRGVFDESVALLRNDNAISDQPRERHATHWKFGSIGLLLESLLTLT